MDKFINKKTIKYIIVGAVVIAVLVIAFILGGNAPGNTEPPKPSELPQMELTEAETATPEPDGEAEESSPEPTAASERSAAAPTAAASVGATEKPTAKEPSAPAAENAPVPEEKTAPQPGSDDSVYVFGDEKNHTCTVSVRCDNILKNMDHLAPDKAGLVPSDGVILPPQTVTFTEGENAFDVTLRVMQKNRIHFEFSKTPAYNSVYIEGINNLYEFDCGELSGWMYRVNGNFYNFGCSQYTVKDGDTIDWLYTCDMGADLGRRY